VVSKVPAVAGIAQALVVARVSPSAPLKRKAVISTTGVRVKNSCRNRQGFLTLTPLLPLLLCLALLAACQKNEEQSAELFVFGTIVEIKLWGASPEEASLAFLELQKMFQGMHRDWHAWEPGRLTNINEAFAEGRSATADPEIVEMVRRSQIIEERSGGRFNPAIGALIRL